MEWDFARKNRAESKSHWCAGARGGITLILQHIDIIAIFQFDFLRYRRLYRHPATRRPGKPMLLPSPWTIIRAISKSTPSGFFAVRPMACLLDSSVCQHNCYSSSSLSASGIASRRRRSSSIVLAASASRCCPSASENRQISPSTRVRVARGDGKRRRLASILPAPRKTPILTKVRESSWESRVARVERSETDHVLSRFRRGSLR